jgi:hypothetical protein
MTNNNRRQPSLTVEMANDDSRRLSPTVEMANTEGSRRRSGFRNGHSCSNGGSGSSGSSGHSRSYSRSHSCNYNCGSGGNSHSRSHSCSYSYGSSGSGNKLGELPYYTTAIRAYKQLVKRFRKSVLVIIHMLRRIPGGLTEVIRIQHTNTPYGGIQNIIID